MVVPVSEARPYDVPDSASTDEPHPAHHGSDDATAGAASKTVEDAAKGKRRRQQQAELVVSSAVASASAAFEDAMPFRALSRPLWRALFQPLLRRFAMLEHAMTTSRPFLILQHVLSLPPTVPFLLSLGLLAVQLRRLWRTQRDALVVAAVTVSQIGGTVRTLADVDARTGSAVVGRGKASAAAGSDNGEGEVEADADDETTRETRRWLAFWTVFAAFSLLETVSVSPRGSSGPTSSSPLLASVRTRLASFLRWAAQSLPDRIRPSFPPPARKPFLEPHPFPTLSARNPGVGFDTSSFAGPAGRGVPLPEAVFGPASSAYLAFKVVLLNWASSERSRGGEIIWDVFLRPFVAPSSSASSDGSFRQRRRKKLRVLVVPETADAAPGQRRRRQVEEEAPRKPQWPKDAIISPPHTPPLPLPASAATPAPTLSRRTQSAPLPAHHQPSSAARHHGHHAIPEEDGEHREAADVMAEWAAGEGNGHWESVAQSRRAPVEEVHV